MLLRNLLLEETQKQKKIKIKNSTYLRQNSVLHRPIKHITMATSVFFLQALSPFLLFLYTSQITAQTPPTNATDFSCSANLLRSCRTGSNFSANITYQIKEDDNFYSVSTHTFENLTNYMEVERLNPSLEPHSLQIGVKVIFPVFCKCPTKKKPEEESHKFLITYVWQPGDDVSKVCSTFKALADDVLSENGNRNLSAAINLPVLIPVHELPLLSQPSSSPQNPGKKSEFHQLLTSALWPGITALVVFCLVCWFGFLHRRSPPLKDTDSIEDEITTE